jgi:hypothetical protein
MKAYQKFGIAVLLVPSFVCIGVLAAQKTAAPAKAPQNTVEGLVRDVACPIQNKESTATRFNLECAKQCAKQGSPLVILTKDGTMYFPISESMPDRDQRPQLLPFVGKFVRATGEVYERMGTQAIVIRKIEEDKSVPLTTDAFQPE